MKRNGNILMGWVLNFMKANGVVNIGYTVWGVVLCDGNNRGWRVDSFFQLSLEKKHIASIVGMIMDL